MILCCRIVGEIYSNFKYLSDFSVILIVEEKCTETHSKVEYFGKIINCWKLHLNVWLGSDYGSVVVQISRIALKQLVIGFLQNSRFDKNYKILQKDLQQGQHRRCFYITFKKIFRTAFSTGHCRRQFFLLLALFCLSLCLQ